MQDRKIRDGNVIFGNVQSDTKMTLEIEKNQILNELNENYIADTEKKLTSYFSWLKHLLTLDTVIIVAFSAFAKEFFCPQIACLFFLFAAIVLSFITLYFGSMGLIGETQFYDTEARTVLNDMENQRRDKKPVPKPTHHFKVRDEYISYSNRSFVCFVATMICISVYVLLGLVFKFVDEQRACCMNFCGIVIGSICVILFSALANHNMKRYRFDWNKMDIYRRALDLAFGKIEELKENKK